MGGSTSNPTAKDVVILHQFPRSKSIPSLSPFALKLETWLRMANIKYENQFGRFTFSKKGKIPWIEYNGEEVADSQFCIEYISNKKSVDLNAHLSPENAAVARAFLKMTEESLIWCMALQRFKFNIKSEELGLPKIVMMFMANKVKSYTNAQGYGLHSKEEVYNIGITDLNALNTFIDTKKFLFGDQVCDVDASLFGALIQLYYTDKGVFHQHIHDNCPNLMRYMETIKQTYWPDWDECLEKKEV